MCNIDAGIKKLKEFLDIRQAINPTASGEYVSFFQMREILEAMRKPEQIHTIQGSCKVPPPTTEWIIEQYSKLSEENQKSVKLFLRFLLSPCPTEVITIDRKVANEFKAYYESISGIGTFVPPIENIYKEFKRALGEKEDICIHNK